METNDFKDTVDFILHVYVHDRIKPGAWYCRYLLMTASVKSYLLCVVCEIV